MCLSLSLFVVIIKLLFFQRTQHEKEMFEEKKTRLLPWKLINVFKLIERGEAKEKNRMN